MRPEVYLAATEPTYEEFPYDGADGPVWRALRRLWSAWGRSPDNPFADWVGPGGTVVIKPNWVMDHNPLGHGLESLVTHTSLIRHMLYWSAVAMRGTGTVIIGDCPLQGCDFAALARGNRMTDLLGLFARQFPELKVEVQDWRVTVLPARRIAGCVAAPQVVKEQGDLTQLRDYDLVDLGRDSFLEEISDYARDFRVTMYKPSLMRAHHGPGKHEYFVARCARDADLFINLPKVKTHIKAGLTGALKNLVGINGLKEFLPHHLKGSYFAGGDCYCTGNVFARWAERWYDGWWEGYAGMSGPKRVACAMTHRLLRAAALATGGGGISAGSWSGNETLWRTVLDLNHLLYFGVKTPKHIITVVDGIVAGEGDGPLKPSPKAVGLLLGGENPACLDGVLAHLMGYNLSRVPLVYHALTHRKSRFAGAGLGDLRVVRAEQDGRVEVLPVAQIGCLGFRKPQYWRRAAVPADTQGYAGPRR
jgi:uncharacterized protein (DUF362 family)